jgi:hypothetical protein
VPAITEFTPTATERPELTREQLDYAAGTLNVETERLHEVVLPEFRLPVLLNVQLCAQLNDPEEIP